MTIRVAMVEDDTRVRESLALLINQAPGFECSQVFVNAEQALERIPEAVPDVVLMDINLPNLSGVECVRRLNKQIPGLNVIMLTVYDDSQLVFQALQAGANGYLLKRASPDEILDAIRDVHQGGAPMSSYIARKVVQSFSRDRGGDPESESLTEREEEILRHVAQGYINKEIADLLDISAETVRTHLKHIYEKLHVRSRTEAVMKYSNAQFGGK